MTSRLSSRARRAAIAIAVCGVLVLAGHAMAQDTELLKSRVLTAVRQASLVSPALKPYRLRGTLILFDGAGHNPQMGSFELLRSGAQVKLTTTFPDASSTFLTNATGSFGADNGTPPHFAAPLLRVVQTPLVFKGFSTEHPTPPPNLPSDPDMECISVVDTTSTTFNGPGISVHEVCLDHTADDLRVIVDDSQQILRDDIFSFGGQRPARRVRLRIGGIVVGEADITQLETASFAEADFTPTTDLKPVRKPPAKLPASVIAGSILTHENPTYPKEARKAHVQGSVVLHAIIGTDGHITDLSVISSPDQSLSDASLKAVHTWTYQPYLVDGKPTAVDTTITVNFNFGK